jgi:hypothetical protein
VNSLARITRAFIWRVLYQFYLMHTEYSVLPAAPQDDERWFLSFESAKRYAQEIHLAPNRYVHIHTDGNHTSCERV